MLVSSLTGTHKPNPDKLAEYECGFPAFEDPRSQFDVRFYLVAILFIIFDLEAAFLYPWSVSLSEIGWVGWATMMVFIFELVLGLVYAWKKGALEWESSLNGPASLVPRLPEASRTRSSSMRCPARSATRASSARPPRTSSPGRAPARCGG